MFLLRDSKCSHVNFTDYLTPRAQIQWERGARGPASRAAYPCFPSPAVYMSHTAAVPPLLTELHLQSLGTAGDGSQHLNSLTYGGHWHTAPEQGWPGAGLQRPGMGMHARCAR